MEKKSNLILRNESGVALVVALLMIVILSLIGLASSSNSTFEIRLSGNKRGATGAFYTAEAGSQSVIANVGNFSTAYYTPVDPAVEFDPYMHPEKKELRYESIDSKNTSPSFSYPGGDPYSELPVVTIYHTSTGGPPRGLGFSAINFGFQNYIIDSIGRDQLDTGAIKSTSQIRTKMVRIVPTTQGGY